MFVNSCAQLVDQYQYAIIDLGALPEDALPSGLDVKRLVPELLAGDFAKMPGLVCLRSIPDQTRALLQENLESAFRGERQHLFSCLLNADDAFETSSIVRHLTSHLILGSPQGKVFLRYYDPRVLQHLEWIFDPSQRRALFGPITHWAVCEPLLLRKIARPEIAGSRRWSVSAEQRQWLDQVGLLNETLEQVRRSQHALKAAEAGPLEALARRILAAMEIAEKCYGLSHDQDLIAFATHAVFHGDDFHEQDVVQTLLSSLSDGENTYADAAPLIDQHLQAQRKAEPHQ